MPLPFVIPLLAASGAAAVIAGIAAYSGADEGRRLLRELQSGRRRSCGSLKHGEIAAVVGRVESEQQALTAPLAGHAKVRHFRQRGMIFAFDVTTDRADFARWFFAEALAQELLLRPIGRTVYLMPPYIVTDAEFELLVARTAEILDAA